MPQRVEPLINGEIYHVINRGVASMPIFLNDRYYRRALQTVFYYQNQNPSLKYSYFNRLPLSTRKERLATMSQEREYVVDIICFCLMPNHIHLLLKQNVDNGITDFMHKFGNSYSHFFNVKNQRVGPLFQGRFKAVRVTTEEQLLHISRYIHLNPYSAGMTPTVAELKDYPHSSFPEYLGRSNNNFCQKEIIMSYFKDAKDYDDFVCGNADYQRELAMIKHLLLETPGDE